GGASHAAAGAVHQDLHAGAQLAEFAERVPGGEKYRGHAPRLGEAHAGGHTEQLWRRHHDLAGVAAKATHSEHRITYSKRGNVAAEPLHHASEIEAGGDGPTHILFGGLVQAHAHDA